MKYPHFNFHVVLVEPEIPQNTGNIGRTCVATWSRLHLVRPLGFELSDKNLKRAGLDYWPDLEHETHKDLPSWEAKVSRLDRVFFFSTKASRSLYDVEFQKGDGLVFGKETKGLPSAVLERFSAQTVKIPFPGNVRSLNLANAVAVSLFEGLRQLTTR